MSVTPTPKQRLLARSQKNLAAIDKLLQEPWLSKQDRAAALKLRHKQAALVRHRQNTLPR